MARLVGFIGNRPDLGARAIALEGDKLGVNQKPADDTTPGSLSWGIGFYQGGEILLKRRPYDDHRKIGFAELTKDIKADVLIGHIRTATVGSLRTENTHPFRYRQWLFAQTGTVPMFDSLRERLRDSLPQFLARDVRGDTDGELVFYLFLSFLHDAGALTRVDVAPGEVRAAIRSTIALVDRLSAEEGAEPTKLNVLIGCGDFLMAIRCGTAMGIRDMHGRSDMERLYGAEGLSRLKIPHLASCRLSLVASDFTEDRVPSAFTSVDERSTVTFTRTEAPVHEPL